VTHFAREKGKKRILPSSFVGKEGGGKEFLWAQRRGNKPGRKKIPAPSASGGIRKHCSVFKGRGARTSNPKNPGERGVTTLRQRGAFYPLWYQSPL